MEGGGQREGSGQEGRRSRWRAMAIPVQDSMQQYNVIPLLRCPQRLLLPHHLHPPLHPAPHHPPLYQHLIIHPMPLASPPPTSPLTFTPRVLSSTAPSTSTPATAISSCSSTAPPASSSAPSMPPPTTPSPFAAPLSLEAPLHPTPLRPLASGATPTIALSISTPWVCWWCWVVVAGRGRGEGWGDDEGVRVGPGANTDVLVTNGDAADSGVRGQQPGEGGEKVSATVEEEPRWGQGHVQMLWRPVMMWLVVVFGNGGWEMERGNLGRRWRRRMP